MPSPPLIYDLVFVLDSVVQELGNIFLSVLIIFLCFMRIWLLQKKRILVFLAGDYYYRLYKAITDVWVCVWIYTSTMKKGNIRKVFQNQSQEKLDMISHKKQSAGVSMICLRNGVNFLWFCHNQMCPHYQVYCHFVISVKIFIQRKTLLSLISNGTSLGLLPFN